MKICLMSRNCRISEVEFTAVCRSCVFRLSLIILILESHSETHLFRLWFLIEPMGGGGTDGLPPGIDIMNVALVYQIRLG